jgi:hypothetical protein
MRVAFLFSKRVAALPRIFPDRIIPWPPNPVIMISLYSLLVAIIPPDKIVPQSNRFQNFIFGLVHHF